MSESAQSAITELDPIKPTEKIGKARPVGLFLLPFVYFYFLSFVLLGVSAYMLLRNPIGVKSSFASEIENHNEDIKITLTKESEANNEVNFECRQEIADKIDSYFSYRYREDGIEGKTLLLPLAGHGCDFDIHGQINNVDPVLVASIAFIESTGGMKTPKYDGIESYNPFGYGVYNSYEKTVALGYHLCDSFEHCIGKVTRVIRKNADKQNAEPNAASVVMWYNPDSVKYANGIIENSSWYKNIVRTMDKINNMEAGIESLLTETKEL